jgi:hypothetical protein
MKAQKNPSIDLSSKTSRKTDSLMKQRREGD